ncbi:MAG: hypothetical protein AAFZ18_09645 [Myxococcota bacterium]
MGERSQIAPSILGHRRALQNLNDRSVSERGMQDIMNGRVASRCLASLAAGSLVVVWAAPARPCSAPVPCPISSVLGGGPVPANVPAIPLRLGADLSSGLDTLPSPPLEQALQVQLVDGTPVPYEVVEGDPTLVTFPSLLPVGAILEVRLWTPECQSPSHEPLSVLFSVGPEAELPDRLGTLTVGEERSATVITPVACGLCGDTVQASTRPVSIDFSPEARAWLGVFQFDVEVNGTWTRDSGFTHLAVSQCSDRTDNGCDAQGGPGHASVEQVRFRARIPGATSVLTERTEVSTACPPEEPSEPGGSEQGCRGAGRGDLWGALLVAIAVGLSRRLRRRPQGGGVPPASTI